MKYQREDWGWGNSLWFEPKLSLEAKETILEALRQKALDYQDNKLTQEQQDD